MECIVPRWKWGFELTSIDTELEVLKNKRVTPAKEWPALVFLTLRQGSTNQLLGSLRRHQQGIGPFHGDKAEASGVFLTRALLHSGQPHIYHYRMPQHSPKSLFAHSSYRVLFVYDAFFVVVVFVSYFGFPASTFNLS